MQYYAAFMFQADLRNAALVPRSPAWSCEKGSPTQGSLLSSNISSFSGARNRLSWREIGQLWIAADQRLLVPGLCHHSPLHQKAKGGCNLVAHLAFLHYCFQAGIEQQYCYWRHCQPALFGLYVAMLVMIESSREGLNLFPSSVDG